MRYELTDDEWFAIRAMLPNKAARCASRERPPKREWYLLSSAIWRNLARSAAELEIEG
jgi:transposase